MPLPASRSAEGDGEGVKSTGDSVPGEHLGLSVTLLWSILLPASVMQSLCCCIKHHDTIPFFLAPDKTRLDPPRAEPDLRYPLAIKHLRTSLASCILLLYRSAMSHDEAQEVAYRSADLNAMETGLFSDCVITCGPKTWNLHRVTLSSRSLWFERALNSQFQVRHGIHLHLLSATITDKLPLK